jgi:two-component system NarL family sensor kinase
VRLQRELHDGLGTTLTSIAFRADAASNLIGTDGDQAERLLGEVRADLRSAIDSVRRVVYGLRPIELDNLGLVGAINERVTTLTHDDSRGIRVAVRAVGVPPVLSPRSSWPRTASRSRRSPTRCAIPADVPAASTSSSVTT